jgi:hypothetical protein
MLIEGVVDIPAQEEKAIDSMLKELERFHKKRSTLHKDASDNAICAALKQYINDVLAPKYKFDYLFWRFVYEPRNSDKAGYVPTHDELFINLAYNVNDSSSPLRSQEINWSSVAESIYHEWVHVKQDDRIKHKHAKGMMTPMLMKIKRNLKRTNPKYIIKWLQKQGLIGPETHSLRKKNPEAYKRILKYAVMFMLKTMAKTATTQ